MKVKFIHAADIHLDSPLLGLERYEGVPVEYVRNATRKAFQNLVDLAFEEKVDLVLLAGNLSKARSLKRLWSPLVVPWWKTGG